ncbi:MAG: MotA/TolQ/ExbB proton channel family protein [Candidatus Cloacimonetes bacterium]|nr:MotA/TolQ/ExbB proton channel family protein [Candidatus Cloacimonadota bacterium]
MRIIELFLSNTALIIFVVFEILIFFFGIGELFFLNAYKKGIRNVIILLDKYLEKYNEVILSEIIDEKRKYHNQFEKVLLSYIKKKIEAGRDIEREEINDIIYYETKNNKRNIESYINILPVIGLIGTFLGIILIIPEINLLIEAIRDSSHFNANNIIQPIVCAFGSSLVGLFFAVVLKALYGGCYKKFSNTKKSLNNFLLIDFYNELKPKKVEEIFASSVNKLSNKITLISNNISDSLNNFLDNFAEQAERQYENLIEVNDKWKNLGDGFYERLDVIVGKQEKSNIVLDMNFRDLLSNLKDTLVEYNIHFKDNVNKFDTIFMNLTDLNKNLHITLQRNDGIIGDYKNIFIEINEKFIEANKELQGIYANLAEVNKGNKELFEKWGENREKMDKNFNELVIKFNNNNRLGSELLRNLNNYLGKIDNRLDMIEDSKKSASDFLESINNIYQKLEDSISNLNQYSGNLDQASHIFVDNIKGQIDALFNQILNKEELKIQFNYPIDKLREEISNSTDKMIECIEKITKESKNNEEPIKKKRVWSFLGRRSD